MENIHIYIELMNTNILGFKHKLENILKFYAIKLTNS